MFENILLRLSLYLQLKNSNSLSFFIILISCLYYFKWRIKNRVFNVRCIVKWGGKTKIDKVPFWGAKKDFKTTGECYNLKLKKKKKK